MDQELIKFMINLNNEITRKLLLVIALSTTTMMFFVGIVNIKNTGLPTSISVTVIMFTIGFVVGTLSSENRNGVYPWTLVGGLIIAIISTVLITCVFSGIMFSVTGGIFKINIDLLIYSTSACMIFSVIALNIISNLNIINKKQFPKEISDDDLEYYDDI